METNDGKKVGDILLKARLTGLDGLQAKLDAASEHIDAAHEILAGLADGVTLGADLIACDMTSRSGDSSSGEHGA